MLTSSVAFNAEDVTPLRLVALTVAFPGTVSVWWTYFHRFEGIALQVLSRADDQAAIGRLAVYTLYAMVGGLPLIAVGDELVIAHPDGHADLATSLVLYAGPALYLLAQRWFMRGTTFVPRSRPAAYLGGLAVLSVATYPAPPVAAAAGAVAVLLAVAVADTRQSRKR